MSKVFNGDTLDKVLEYLDQHFEALANIENAVRDRSTSESFMRRKNMVALDGTGSGTISLPVPLGYDWILQRVTITSTGNGMVSLFVDTTNPSDLVEIIGSTQLYSDAFNNEIYVPGGSTLFAVFTNAGNNGQATVNLQIKVVKHDIEALRPQHPYTGEV